MKDLKLFLMLLVTWVSCLLTALLYQQNVSLSIDIIQQEPDGSSSRKTKNPDNALYPRWSGGIKIDDLAAALRVSLDHKLYINRVHTVYIVRKDGASYRLYKASVKAPTKSSGSRESRMEPLAYSVLRRPDLIDAHPFLKKALEQGGFTYMTNHGDSDFCLEPTPFTTEKKGGRVVLNVSVPIFTNSAPLLCTKSFPYPHYRIIYQAGLKDWSKLVQEYRATYPWHKKKRQAVWRGSPTGAKNSERNTRLRFVQHSGLRPELIDAKFIHGSNEERIVYNETAYRGQYMPMEDFQRYRAIVDVDGNSWSARFAQQLCYSSVTIKVEPEYVDYFYMELQPWVHYIPVSADMSDLYKNVEFALSDKHEEQVREIVANANEWCRNKLRPEQLTKDLAHIWDVYLKHLYEANPNWSETWLREEEKLLSEYNFNLVDE